MEQYDCNGNIIKPLTIKKVQKLKSADIISYKDKSKNRYKLGPLDKVLKYDSKITKGRLTLNSIINFGELYKGCLISDIYIKDIKYLKFVANKHPNKFSDELLKLLK